MVVYTSLLRVLLLIRTLILNLLPNAVVHECKDGEIAVKTFETFPIDLIFMDIQMPKLDGLDATRMIRAYENQLDKKTPIIALTAGTLSEEKAKCIQAGMDSAILDPTDSDMLGIIYATKALLKKDDYCIEYIEKTQEYKSYITRKDSSIFKLLSIFM